ncbi:MAG TPA: ERAP1-like C-terminal domain-containing protein [Burkholderiaceae bacterium]|nr:ERAP1-like C-terminal domain-containing protein [Burkholderiaceae bacterium]
MTALIGGWTEQPGFPLLNVNARCRRGRTEVEIAQERFTAKAMKQIAAMWQVPVVVSAGRQSQQILLGREPQRVSFPGCKAVVANGGDTGYYRVQYNAEAMARLRAEFAQLPAVERSGLIADTFALARAGRIGFVEYFTLLERLRAGAGGAKTQSMEREGAIWEQVVEGLTFLDETFHGTPTQARLRAHARGVLAPVLAHLGWQPRAQDDLAALRLRSRLIDALGAFDDRATIERAQKLLDGGRGEQRLPASIREGVIRTAARHADDATFEWLRQRLREAGNQEDDYLYGGALMRVRDPKHVQRVLDLTLTDEWRPTSAAYYASHIGESSGHPELARAFVREHFVRLAAKASDWSRSWLLPGAYAGLSDEAAADELLGEQEKRLGADARHPTGPAAQVAATIRERAAVRAREAEQLEVWLRNRTRAP